MNDLIKRYPSLSICENDIENAVNLMIDTYKNGGKILLCGNGGSAADCEHIVGELMKGFLKPRKVEDDRLPKEIRENIQGGLFAISLPSQTALISAFNNDVNPDMLYAQMVYTYAKEKDLLIALSTSGNSKNIVNAAITAKAVGAKVLAMTGDFQSKLLEISDVTIKAPQSETYKIQEYHLPIYHYLCAKTEEFFY